MLYDDFSLFKKAKISLLRVSEGLLLTFLTQQQTNPSRSKNRMQLFGLHNRSL